ncbi:hypothetical protein ABPG75_011722 [Micractinium tetrahymenae]
MRHTMHAARSGACLLQAARPRAALAEVAAALRRPAARQRLLLTPVTAGYQQPLNSQQRKAKRAEAQRLGRSICMVNLGQQGLTPQFLEGFRLAIAANELVKVRVGACDDTLEEVAEALAAAGDCVLVHSIGFTLTFYRQAAARQRLAAGMRGTRAQQARTRRRLMRSWRRICSRMRTRSATATAKGRKLCSRQRAGASRRRPSSPSSAERRPLAPLALVCPSPLERVPR